MADELTVYGVDWCPECRRVKTVLGEYQIPYRWVDTDHDSGARTHVEKINGGDYRFPTLEFSDGSVLVEPANAELKVKLGITGRASKPIYDVIIVGGGPAGLTAAIYTGRDSFDTLIIEDFPYWNIKCIEVLQSFHVHIHRRTAANLLSISSACLSIYRSRFLSSSNVILAP